MKLRNAIFFVACMILQANNNIAIGRGLNGEASTALVPDLVPNFVMVLELLADFSVQFIGAWIDDFVLCESLLR